MINLYLSSGEVGEWWANLEGREVGFYVSPVLIIIFIIILMYLRKHKDIMDNSRPIINVGDITKGEFEGSGQRIEPIDPRESSYIDSTRWSAIERGLIARDEWEQLAVLLLNSEQPVPDASQRTRRAIEMNLWLGNVDTTTVLKNDNFKCGICGENIDPYLRHPERMAGTIDHIVPLKKGGHHWFGNVQAAHYSCNSRKRDSVTSEDINRYKQRCKYYVLQARE
ncbi:HNH endonuclease [Corynebacterium sp. AOP40-9SA-29]|uniref:HNH endonuclease n=1 Tax=Corynebacterium sp. AOP40-9SA-29 TaxID=3457677 RepID=UPI0040344031